MAKTPAKPAAPAARSVAAKPAPKPVSRAAAPPAAPILTAKQKAQIAQDAAVRRAMAPRPAPATPPNPVRGLAEFAKGAKRMLSLSDIGGAVDRAADKR